MSKHGAQACSSTLKVVAPCNHTPRNTVQMYESNVDMLQMSAWASPSAGQIHAQRRPPQGAMVTLVKRLFIGHWLATSEPGLPLIHPEINPGDASLPMLFWQLTNPHKLVPTNAQNLETNCKSELSSGQFRHRGMTRTMVETKVP